MKNEEANEIVNALANGLDPETGEVLPKESPYNCRKVRQALFIVLYYSEAAQQNQSKFSRKQANPTKTIEERQQKNLTEGKPKNAGLPWTDKLRNQLVSKFQRGVTVAKLSNIFMRTPGAIRSELIKQNQIVED